MKKQVAKLIDCISEGLRERDDIVALSLLALLSGQSVFLYGPPGTAKSLIARRLSLAFKGSKYFEYLMNRFSTPEEVFGPVSIRELKEDRYIRKTAGYLPEADIAFLDEIWKSSPAILNTLLTIINERKFHNGDRVESVPLKGIVAASNEIPSANQGLEALYDRFVVRLVVDSMRRRDNFEALLSGAPVKADIEVNGDLQFDAEAWKNALGSMETVVVPKETLNVIHSIRVKIDEYNAALEDKSEALYISDRRWLKMMQVLKMAAHLCDRGRVSPADVMILKNCLWTKPENREILSRIVKESVRQFCLPDLGEFDRWCEDLQALSDEADKNLFYGRDVPANIVMHNGHEFVKVTLQVPCYSGQTKTVFKDNCVKYVGTLGSFDQVCYLPVEFVSDPSIHFQPFNERFETKDFFFSPHGLKYPPVWVNCWFEKPSVCKVMYTFVVENNRRNGNDPLTEYVNLNLLHKAGDRIDLPDSETQKFRDSINGLLARYKVIEANLNEYCTMLKQENDTPFVPKKDQAVVNTLIREFQKTLSVKRLDAEQLAEKIGVVKLLPGA